MTEAPVPFLDLTRQTRALEAEIRGALERVCRRAAFASGPEVVAFERAFAAYCGVPAAVAVNSGTSALHLALRALAVGPGDEVILPAFTFVATAWAVLYCGATPVLADVDPVTRTLSPGAAARRLSPRTRVLLPVHLYGLPADMEALAALAEEAGAAVVEDAAQAHGARYRGRRVGGLGRLGCFSFYPTKNLGACGEGGAVTTCEESLADRVGRLRDHAQTERYLHMEVGYNYRMSGFQGAVLKAKLPHLDAWNARRAALAERYNQAFQDLPLRIPRVPPDRECVWHLYVVEVEDREDFRRFLAEKYGVATAVHYPRCLHEQPVFRRLGLNRESHPVAEALARRVVALPLFPELTDGECERVIAAVRAYFVG